MVNKSLTLATGSLLGAFLLGLVACSDVSPVSNVADGSSMEEQVFSSVISAGENSTSKDTVDACSFAEIADLWYGPDGSERVNTGMRDSMFTDGYWFGVEDVYKLPLKVYWPPVPGNVNVREIDNSIMGGCVEGLCTILNFKEAGFAGVGFGIDGSKFDESWQPGDVSSWGGLCVAYASESDVDIVLSGVLDDLAWLIAGLPKFTLPSSREMTTKCVAWNEFVSATGEAADPTRLVDVFFVVHGDSATISGLTIKGVGRYKQLKNAGCSEPTPFILDVDLYKKAAEDASKAMKDTIYTVQDTEPRQIEEDSTDVCKLRVADNLWYGPDWEERVETRIGNDTETSGYWFSVENTGEGEASRFNWPVAKGNIYSSDAMGGIIEACSGICAELNFQSSGFAGVGFDIAGEKSPYDGSLAMGDALSWGGLCVTYASELDMDIVMSNGEKVYVGRIPDMPKATLPKSIDVTTKCVEWNQFVSKTGYAGDPTKFASLLFVSYGDSGTKGKFKIVGLGSYQKLLKPGCTLQDDYVSGK